MGKVLISANEASQAPRVLELLKVFGIPHEVAPISFELADYIINGWIDADNKPRGAMMVERTTVADYWGKIKSGRGNNQLVDLSASIRLSILAIIGYLETDLPSQIQTDYHSAMGGLLAGVVSAVWKRANIDIHETFTGGGNISVINFISEEGFVLFLNELLKWCDIEDPRIPKIERLSRKPEWQYLFWLQSIHGIGEHRSRALMFAFATPYDLITASVEEINAVEGFGKVLSQNLYNFFRNPPNPVF